MVQPAIITIHDVEHGFCSSILTPNDKIILIDCGSNSSNGWKPSSHFGGARIESFVISNFDNDHLDDFRDLSRLCPIQSYWSNWSLSHPNLIAIKGHGNISDSVRCAIQEADKVNPLRFPANSYTPSLGGLDLGIYWNSVCPDIFDTNNLSVATIVQYGSNKILFGGDLERKGWQALLQNIGFLHAIRGTTVLVASHHGRETGYCEDLFRHISPEIVIFSDKSIQHESQKTASQYYQKASGITYFGKNRTVFSTRNDGDIRLILYVDHAEINCVRR